MPWMNLMRYLFLNVSYNIKDKKKTNKLKLKANKCSFLNYLSRVHWISLSIIVQLLLTYKGLP